MSIPFTTQNYKGMDSLKWFFNNSQFESNRQFAFIQLENLALNIMKQFHPNFTLDLNVSNDSIYIHSVKKEFNDSTKNEFIQHLHGIILGKNHDLIDLSNFVHMINTNTEERFMVCDLEKMINYLEAEKAN